MEFSDILFWVIIAVLAYVLLKAGLAVLIIVIILVVIFYLLNALMINNSTNTTYYPDEEFEFSGRVYNDYTDNNIHTKELGLDTGHDNYWYIPIQKYYEEGIGIDKHNAFNHCNIPGCLKPVTSVSEYCFGKRMQQSGDFDWAVSQCSVPGKISVNCAG